MWSENENNKNAKWKTRDYILSSQTKGVKLKHILSVSVVFDFCDWHKNNGKDLILNYGLSELMAAVVLCVWIYHSKCVQRR